MLGSCDEQENLSTVSEVKMEIDESLVIKEEGRSTRARRTRKTSSQPLYNEEIQYGSDSDSGNTQEDDPEFSPNKNTKSALSGFALFCQENKGKILQEFPDISPIKLNAKLSHLWSELPSPAKRNFSTRAKHILHGQPANYHYRQARRKAKANKESASLTPGMTQPITLPEPDLVAFCCAWESCDHMFEVVDECAQHISDAHLRPLCEPETETLIRAATCRWRGCSRLKRCCMPFCVFERLSRHVTEEHVLVGKMIKPSQLSQNYFCRRDDT